MQQYLIDWLNLGLRWLHVVTGIAWIGSSFYFMWLDAQLRPAEEPKEGVAGEVWSVHGGGFYQVQKFAVAPKKLPKVLHWFYWEAYTTWISGFCLLAVVYYWGAEVFLIDKNKIALELWQAIGISLSSMVAGWLVYHGLCASKLKNFPYTLAFLLVLWLSFIAFGLHQVFSNRAAYLHFGAILGTIMAANVFFVIIPNQRKLVRLMINQQPLDLQLGLHGKLRSTHNNYFTLPVLFVMISSHYPVAFQHKYNWILLICVSLGSALLRHYFNRKNQGKTAFWILVAATLSLLSVVFVFRPAQTATSVKTQTAGTPIVDFRQQIMPLMRTYCIACHSTYPTSEFYTAAPNGLLLETPEQIKNAANLIHQQVVVLQGMPLGNITEMKAEDRELIDQWFQEGALIE